MFGHCAEDRFGRQSYVLHTLCPFFEEMDAVGCGSPCVGIACKHALHEDTQCNTHRKEGLWTKAGNGSQSYVLCNVAPSLKRRMRSGAMFGHCRVGIACKHALHEDTRCNTHRKEGLWTKAGNESQSYVLRNVCPFFEEMHALGVGGHVWALRRRQN